jgi:hypothetical protein
MSKRLYRPASLRALLAGSTDVTNISGWYRLAEGVMLFDGDDKFRRLCVESFRRWTDTWLERSERFGDIGLDQATFSSYLWKAEALEDPELARQLESGLPEEVRERFADRRAMRSFETHVRLPVRS